MSPLLTAFVGGILGGIACGTMLGLALALFGRRIADGLIRQEVSRLEARILDEGMGRIAKFLDQSERIGQIVKRVVEIAQLALGRASPSELKPVLEPK